MEFLFLNMIRVENAAQIDFGIDEGSLDFRFLGGLLDAGPLRSKPR
jgi:hypothetical protein